MLNDIHVQKTMKSALMSARKEAQGCKLILDGFWSYICPDLFAFCQWLFLGQDVPDGLIPEGYITIIIVRILRKPVVCVIPTCQIVNME